MWLSANDLSWSLGACQVNQIFLWFGKLWLDFLKFIEKLSQVTRVKVIGPSVLNFSFKHQVLT